jgi:hypothetical protein
MKVISIMDDGRRTKYATEPAEYRSSFVSPACSGQAHHRRLLPVEWLVLALSLFLCAFFFSGRLQSADELAVYALTYNLSQRGELDINVLASTAPGMRAPPFSGVGEFGPDGSFYSGKGVLPSLLALPLLRVALWLPGVDPVMSTLLLNVLLTALTAFVIARHVRLRYGDGRAALVIGLLYVSGTMALAYSKRLFTEPAAALCVVLAFHLLDRDWGLESGDYHDVRSLVPNLFLAGLALGGAVAASYANAVVVPCMALLVAAIVLPLPMTARRRVECASAFVAGLLPWAVGLALYNVTRFGDVTRNGLPLLAWSLPYFTPQAALVRIYALLFSPYRGLLWYNPLLLLAPLALWLAYRRTPSRCLRLSRPALWLALGAATLYVLFYSAWSMWWGGFNWGPRFLLPVLPLWMLALTPVFVRRGARDTLPRPGSSSTRIDLRAAIVRVAVLAIATASVTVALVGGLVDTFRAEGALAERGLLSALVTPQAISDSPLLTDWAYFQAASGADQLARGELDVWWTGRDSPRDEGADGTALMHALADIGERATTGSAVLVVAPRRIEPLLHAYHLAAPLYGLTPDQADTDLLKQALLAGHTRILLLTDAGMTDPANVTERWLERHAFRARNEFYAPWRMAAFGTPMTITAVSQSLVQWQRSDNGPNLRMSGLAYSLRVRPGGAVAIHVKWQRGADDPRDLDGVAWYAHLIAPDGTLVSQHDALVGDGYGWGGAVTIEDRRGILVPANARPGRYRVHIGVYGPGGQRFSRVDEHGTVQGDVVSMDVEVAP